MSSLCCVLRRAKLTEKLLPHFSVGLVPVPNGSLGKPVCSDFICDIGPTESRARNAKSLLNDIGENIDVGVIHVNTLPIQMFSLFLRSVKTRADLDERDGFGALLDFALQVF